MPPDFEMEDSDSSHESTFPKLHLWALDTLAIPAMSAECGRVFSSTKKLINPERNHLSEESIEASECLNWWDRGLITQQEDAEVTHEGSKIEGESESEL